MRYNEFKQTKTSKVVESLYKQLNEVNMSPTALQSFLNSDLGKQVIAGFEAELDFPDEDFKGDSEPDYDNASFADVVDEDFTGFDNAVDFFYNGGEGDSRRDIESMISDWMIERVDEYLDDHLSDMIEYLVNSSDNIIDELEDVLEEFIEEYDLQDQIPDEFKDEDGDIEYSYDLAKFLAKNNISELVTFYQNNTEHFSDTQDSIREEADEVAFNSVTMRDIYQNTDLSWPLDYDNPEFPESNNGEFDYSELINMFLNETDGFGYEAGQDRDGEYTVWNFTNDVSLDDNTGVEIVSPAMPLTELLKVMPKFFEWVENNGGTAVRETGIHMSVSLPNYSYDNLDFMKMALFLGDRYVLDQFGRYGNGMTHLAFDYHTGNTARSKVNKFTKDRVGTAKAILSASTFDSLKDKLTNASRAIIEKSNGYQKFVTIHPKEEYVEIRSAGNVDYFKDIEKLKNTIIRYAYALSIALDPEAEKKEYAKKLYLALSAYSYDSAEGLDKAKIFALYSAGLIDNTELKNYINKINAKGETDITVGGKSGNGYHVLIKNEILKNFIDNNMIHDDGVKGGFIYRPRDFGTGATTVGHYQSLLPNIRKYLVDSMLDHLQSFDNFPKIKTASGKIETFDPRNKEHLPDNEIVITKVEN